ncbi:MAG: YdeI/OmpD-associated family protein [Bacteroidetes bacterium]|nr:YdeI/OmpD-associated family protein [Bacteroidota bacterium]
MPTTTTPTPTYFETPEQFRAWLKRNHASATELYVGFYKKSSGKPSITWPESVDEALCVGWIDAVRKRIDHERYYIRFTPRKPKSIWSAVNIKRIGELKALGRLQKAGLIAFESRDTTRSNKYSFEQSVPIEFTPAQRAQFKANKKAWTWFESKAPSYRKAATWWVISAKREETKAKRLLTLIEDSAAGRVIKPLSY